MTPFCRDSLYNTNGGFDWGAFRKLEEELTQSWTPPSFFPVVLGEPGVYVFRLSSHPHRHMVNIPNVFLRPDQPLQQTDLRLHFGGEGDIKFIPKLAVSCVPVSHRFVSAQYVRVMPTGARCYEPGPFFPAVPRHMTRMGIKRRGNLLLRPDWLVTGGLLFGAAFILCLCVSVLVSGSKVETAPIADKRDKSSQ